MDTDGRMHSSPGESASWSSASSATGDERAIYGQQATAPWPLFQNEPLFDDEVKIENFEIDKKQLDEVKAARRRQYHKEVVARSRLRHKMSTAAIQQQEQVLGRKLRVLLQQTGHQVTQRSESTVVPNYGGQELHQYAEQVAVQERILLENKELRRRIEAHSKLYDAIEKESAQSNIGECVKGVEDLPELSTGGTNSWIYFDDDEDPIYFVPLTKKNCEKVVRTVFQRTLNLYSIQSSWSGVCRSPS
ncbi:hypothetical protein GN958_ATG08541 [Phytophthora infestans]|uniref:Uncharacterized protein n=1 Tax=Phytophthora infestans TaxID=4787 RepID=A0A8S9UNF4_PHYIN|nr:hypothetical protein GN958_ATG08541 [Phytophthora infestans]